MAFELKRFWDKATVAKTPNGFEILLDKRPLKTPLKNNVVVPTFEFARLIADEWQSVSGKVDKFRMPFTRMAEAALDAAPNEHAQIVANLAGYGETDLLCYRAHTPTELINRQAKNWDPLLAWAAQELNAPLRHTQGIMAIVQAEKSIDTLRKNIEAFSLFQLTAFYDLVKLSGSLIIALGVAQGHIDVKTGWRLSRIDDDWQIEQWGSDDEAEELAKSRQQSFENAHLALKLLTNSQY